MKISFDWLSDFLTWHETDPERIADEMTRCMGEVDAVETQGKFLEHCVVGRIDSIAKHPSADRLSVCVVETDRGKKTVVCGGTNLRQDMLIAFAHVGATVRWHGGETMTLASVKLRGVQSDGMICAAEELELATLFPPDPAGGAHPIIDLTSRGLAIGTPLREALQMNDVVFHIDNHAITNRPDLFSHIGVARELVAMGLASWKKTPAKKRIVFPATPCTLSMTNAIPTLVPRYMACSLRADGPGTTPDWMRRRLEATGWRCINLAVDITNYVAMEHGMPLHCFDADDIEGGIQMRTAKEGETITTLDTVERSLPAGAIVLSDDRGIFDLLGIMGGQRSSTKDTSRNLYLHAAIVDPTSIRTTILKTGHRTDAATVYEKGIPFDAVERGMQRALELFLSLMPGATITSEAESWGAKEPAKAIAIPTAKFSSFIGTPITGAAIKKIFSDLGFAVKGAGKTLSITPPAWRHDVTMQQDLIEEVARIYRYAAITPVMPSATITPPARDHRHARLRDALSSRGFFELLHLAFVSPELLKRCSLDPAAAVMLENPLGEELSCMRTSLLPSMLQTLSRELRTAVGTVKVFEVGRVFRSGQPERTELCLVIGSKTHASLKDDPTLRIKDDLIQGAKYIGHSLVVVQGHESPMPFVHPGRVGTIMMDGITIGTIGEIHPSVRSAFDIEGRTACAIVDLSAILARQPVTSIYEALPAFPAISFDETLPLAGPCHAERIARAKAVSPLLRSVDVVDTYDAGQSGSNVTLRFTYRADDRTLVQADTEKVHAQVMGEIKKM